MQFGSKRKDAPAESEAGSTGRYLRNFKAGETKVRFLEETEDWIVFREHYLGKQSFPCTGERDTCPGCTHPDEDVQRAGRKYACNVYLVDVEKTLPFRIPVSLAKSMDMRSEKNGGTITNRDYVVMRSGKGLDTEYDVDSDERYSLDIAGLLKDGMKIEELLEESYNEVWGDKVEEAPKKERFAKEKEEPKAAEPEEVFPSKPGDDAGEEEIVIDEDALYDMSVDQLRELATKVGVETDEDAGKRDLIRLLLSEVGV